MNKRQIQNTIVIAAIVTAAYTAFHANTNWLSSREEKQERERCYGVAASAQNDCATANHSCAFQAKRTRDPEEFIMVPKGLCKRIGGSKGG
jgi:uncharacterized membrane protein